jgi:Phage terminase large subunit
MSWAWRQAGPQHALVECPLKEIFFGGTRGGGKTDRVLGKWALKEEQYGPDFNALMFRKTTVSAEDAIERSREIYEPLGGAFNHGKLRWRMPNGGRVGFAYLETVKDADQYQGRNVTDIWVEEAGLYETPDPIDRLFGVLRSAQGVPVQLILTGNPGGAGQHWIRHRYHLYPFPRHPKVLQRKLPNNETHRVAVIPSRIYDNRYLGKDYINSLHMVGSAQLVKAWLDGDWTAIEGAFFDCWSEAKHVIPPFTIPSDWIRFRSMDWGSASPASVGWWAVVQDDFHLPHPSQGLRWDDHSESQQPASDKNLRRGSHRGAALLGAGRGGRIVLPRGALVRYREDYIADPRSHKGLKLTGLTCPKTSQHAN